MCDYSLAHLASRPARVGDTLITTKFGALADWRVLRRWRAERSRVLKARNGAGVRARDRNAIGILEAVAEPSEPKLRGFDG